MGMGIVSNCCTQANNDDERDAENENNQTKADIQKIISSQPLLSKEEMRTGKMSLKRLNTVSYKPYIGIQNYKNSGFINVNLQILSRLTYFKDFVNIMGKTLKSSILIQNFIKIIDSISHGVALDNSYIKFVDEVLEKHQFIEISPLNFLLFFLDKLSQAIYGAELAFDQYKLGVDEISTKNVENLKGKFTSEFSFNDIKTKFFTGFLTNIAKQCKNIKCTYKSQEVFSTVQPYLEITVDPNKDKEFNLQDRVNSFYFDKQIEGECERCGKINKKYILTNRMLINNPKYLIILIQNKEGIPLDLSYLKNKQLVFFSKNYEIFSIVSQHNTPGESEIPADYSCSIKIDYKWINFNDDIITIVDEDNLFNNSYILYYQQR
jgi:hypothetical protein